MFRNSTTFMEPDENPFAIVARYSERALLSGFVSPENLEKVRQSVAVCANRMGQGTVIRMIDNPNFRGVWYGTNKLFANAIFFGGVIKSTRPLGR